MASPSKDQDHDAAIVAVSRIALRESDMVFLLPSLFIKIFFLLGEENERIESGASLDVAFLVRASVTREEIIGFIEFKIAAKKIHVLEE